MTSPMKRTLMVLMSLLLVVLTALAGYQLGQRHAGAIGHVGKPIAASPAPAVLYWYDPMIPEQHFKQAGLSPMGMPMIPKYATTTGPAGSVPIAASTREDLGVRVETAQRRRLSLGFETQATVAWDPRQAYVVSARVDAVINHLAIKAPYSTVRAGAALASLLAPAWSSALAEASVLQHSQSSDAGQLQQAAQQRLAVLGLSAADIRGSQDGQITLHAPRGGVVTAIAVQEGQRVSAGQPLMTVMGRDPIWIEAPMPQALAATVRVGTPVTVRSAAWPGQLRRGRVDTVVPQIDPQTRTQLARIVLANPDGQLVAGQFVQVSFAPGTAKAVLSVPDQALISTGAQTRVIVEQQDSQFRPVLVQTGRHADGYTEILAGLDDATRVVVSGQFLIDSEASLAGALDRLHAGAADPPAAMGGIPMAASSSGAMP